MKNLKDKYVLITGAAGGIGSVLAKQLLQKGCHLILVDLQEEKLNQLQSELESSNENASIEVFVIDLTKEFELEQLVQSITHLDILINNAGIVYGESFNSSEWALINKTLSVNLLATMKLTHLLLPLLMKNKESHITNMASGAGLLGPGGMVAYGASKHGLVGFSEALRAELKEYNIGVSVICPPFVKTGLITNNQSSKNAKDLERLNKLDALVQKDGITPEKVASSTIKAIQRNRAIVKIGALVKGALIIKFFFPRLVGKMNHKNYLKMKTKGQIK